MKGNGQSKTDPVQRMSPMKPKKTPPDGGVLIKDRNKIL